MSKYTITLNRYAIQSTQIEVEVEGGAAPMSAAPAITDPSLVWTTTSTIPLSHDVVPVEIDA